MRLRKLVNAKKVNNKVKKRIDIKNITKRRGNKASTCGRGSGMGGSLHRNMMRK